MSSNHSSRARIAGTVAALAIGATLVAVEPAQAAAPVASRAAPAGQHWYDDPGPNLPVTELVGQFKLPKLDPDEAHLSVTKYGYRIQGGANNQRVVITEVDGGLRFVDRAATSWDKLPGTCRRVSLSRGVAAQCRIPAQFEQGRMFIEAWPRLGADSIDGGALSSKFRMWVITDAGKDDVVTGAGEDFINTAFDSDTADAGDGDDWVRAGDSRNAIDGGGGEDKLIGGDGSDRIHGGPGDDTVNGQEGDDTLWGDDGADVVKGGPGRDVAYRLPGDRVSECEVVR